MLAPLSVSVHVLSPSYARAPREALWEGRLHEFHGGPPLMAVARVVDPEVVRCRCDLIGGAK